MLEGLALKLRGLKVEPVTFDPADLGDDVATRTEWEPAKSGGSNFRTHRFVAVDHGRAEFRATPGAVAFYLIFLLMGLGVMVVFTIATRAIPEGSGEAFPLIFPIVIGSIFVAVGGGMLYFGTAPIVFDRGRGEFWKGRVAPYEAGNRLEIKHHTKLDRIHALQIISERCRTKNSTYYSYELNLVLDDATRMNVIDHGDLDDMRRDAETLAKLLGKPLWDATV
jgi:hypothetical protein